MNRPKTSTNGGWLRRTIYMLGVLGALGLSSVQAEERQDAQPSLHLAHSAMGADFDLFLFGGKSLDTDALRVAAEDAFVLVDALEQRISTWITGSPADMMNRRAYPGPVVVDHDLFALMQTCRRYYDQTGGVFDVSVGPLLEMWGFYGKKGEAPTEEAVKLALGKIGLKHVRLEPETRQVTYEKPGMRVDFGGIGKGLALDRMANLLRDRGVEMARLDGGTSTIVVLGTPPGKDGWTVDIRSPYNVKDGAPPIATVVIRGESLSTSSSSERFVEHNGKRYSHIFDPRTGMPVDTGIVSATAIAPTGTESDMLSTAFYVMGVEGAREYCRARPEVRAVLATDKDRTGKPDVVYINFPQP